MGFEIKGLDDVQRKLRQLETKARELDGAHDIPLGELFPASFMRSYTKFGSIDAMFRASGFNVETTDDFKQIPDAGWDAFVRSSTNFRNWDEMMTKAGELWVARRLEL